jgi:molecular chaperone GrpE
MTDTTARPTDDAAERPDEAAAPGPADEKKIAELVEALARESAEYKDKMLRTLAEMENLRRRTEREVADARTYGIAAFARDVLGVADNMHRALQALDAEQGEGKEGVAEAGTKAFIEGVQLTERDLLKTLDKHGVKKFEPSGERFDPNLHQAMYEVADPSVPSGTVAQVVQAGYMIGDRVLRPALVAVSKGGPKPAPAEPSANDNTGADSDPQDAD